MYPNPNICQTRGTRQAGFALTSALNLLRSTRWRQPDAPTRSKHDLGNTVQARLVCVRGASHDLHGLQHAEVIRGVGMAVVRDRQNDARLERLG